MSNKTITAIIVTAGTQGYIYSCIDSLLLQTHQPVQIIVIVNLSDRELINNLSVKYPQILIKQNNQISSYGNALNLGIRASISDYILCLNDDLTLDLEFIKEGLKGFLISEKIGMVSPKILRMDKITIDTTGLSLSLWRTAIERGYGQKDLGQLDKDGFVFGSCAAAVFYRKEMLENIKTNQDYFDPRFKYFYEDLDLAWRAQKKGWLGYYCHKAIAYHVRGGTARNNKAGAKGYARAYLSDDLLWEVMKNRYLTLWKNESAIDFILHLPFILVYEIASWGYWLKRKITAKKGFTTE